MYARDYLKICWNKVTFYCIIFHYISEKRNLTNVHSIYIYIQKMQLNIGTLQTMCCNE